MEDSESSRATGPGEATADEDALTRKVDQALLERPGFSIRARLALVFLLFFLASAGIAVATWGILNRLQTRLQFIEIADQLNNEILQARRFEKNYLLYGSNLDDVLECVDAAQGHLASSEAEFESIVGAETLRRLEGQLVHYRGLLVELRGGPSEAERAGIEARLREDGAELVSLALELAGRERGVIRSLLRLSKGVPMAFLLFILGLSLYSAYFLSRHIIHRLNRLMNLTRRIGAGDLSPIVPARKFRDEFTNLVVALNHMMHEVEHRQRAMVQSHKLRAVGKLTAGVAHELNNPINNIMLTAAVLQEEYEGLSDDERLEMVRELAEQAERSRRTVRNLLDFARESGMEVSRLDVNGLLDESVALVGNELRLSGIKVERETPRHLPPVNGDRQYLNQIFVNLILNAIDAMPEGGTLAVSASAHVEPGFVAVSLRDSGEGIPEHVLQSIFDPFFTTKPTGKGTGLGLSVSLGIARQHGGDIRVESEAGTGSTFTVLLPSLDVPAALGCTKQA